MPTRPAQSHSHFRSIWTRIHETIKRLSWISSDQLTPKQRRRLQLLLMTWQIQRPSFCLSRAVVCHPHLVVSVSCKLITRSQIIQSLQKQWWHLHPNEKHTDTSAYLQPTMPCQSTNIIYWCIRIITTVVVAAWTCGRDYWSEISICLSLCVTFWLYKLMIRCVSGHPNESCPQQDDERWG